METERRESSTARVPIVEKGKAIVYTRYDREKTVVVNPEDFYRLEQLDAALNELTFAPPEMSDLALKAHTLEDEPGQPLEDPEAIKTLLGL